MRLAVFIFLISFNQINWAHNYRLNCDPCVSSALCQSINNYLVKFDPNKIALKELAKALQARFTSLDKVSLTKSWDGKVDVQISSVEPVYIIDLKHSDRIYVLARASSSEINRNSKDNFSQHVSKNSQHVPKNHTQATPQHVRGEYSAQQNVSNHGLENNSRIVPALWINPTCLENLPAVCLNLKNSKAGSKHATKLGLAGNSTKSKASIIGKQSGYGVIIRQDLSLISQVPVEFKDFLLTLDPEISANFLIEWVDRNQIILRYCKLAENYNCKLVVRVNNLDSKILTPEFLARCLNLLPAELFVSERLSEIVTANSLGKSKITGTSGLDNGLAKFSNFKTKKNSLKNFTIDLRFNKQIVILND
jgi:hypothetical protein